MSDEDDRAAIHRGDIDEAVAEWRRTAPARYRALLDAEPDEDDDA